MLSVFSPHCSLTLSINPVEDFYNIKIMYIDPALLMWSCIPFLHCTFAVLLVR